MHDESHLSARLTAVALAAMAIACLAYSAISPRWIASADNTAGAGLRASTTCFALKCEHRSLSESVEDLRRVVDQFIASTDDKTLAAMSPHERSAFNDQQHRVGRRADLFIASGWVTTVAIGAVVVMLLISILFGIAGRMPRLPITPMTLAMLASLISLASGCALIVTNPWQPGMFGVSWGFWIFGAGDVLTLLAAPMMARALRHPDADSHQP